MVRFSEQKYVLLIHNGNTIKCLHKGLGLMVQCLIIITIISTLFKCQYNNECQKFTLRIKFHLYYVQCVPCSVLWGMGSSIAR